MPMTKISLFYPAVDLILWNDKSLSQSPIIGSLNEARRSPLPERILIVS